jgi:nicotinate-nucleotide adenylyltransferase
VTETGRTGVLGGTFDPIHVGHLAVASEARRALALDEVLFLPLRIPAHRPVEPVASPEDRLAMADLATTTSGEPFRALDIELKRPGPSYTADTLRALRARERGRDFLLLLGADAAADLDQWREAAALPGLARFLGASIPAALAVLGIVAAWRAFRQAMPSSRLRPDSRRMRGADSGNMAVS